MKRISSAAKSSNKQSSALATARISLLTVLALPAFVGLSNDAHADGGINYSITYNDGVVTNMPTDLSSTSIGSNVTLSSNTPAWDKHNFLGWCSGTITNSDGIDSCSGTTYAAGGTYTLDGTTTNNISLTAMWSEPKTIANATYMQEVGSCPDTLTTGQVYSLKDSRDEQSYNVAKLADGKCWMITNLNLAGGTVLSSDKSDVPSTNYYTLPASTTISSGTSVQSGQFSSDTTAYVFNTGNNTTTCNSSTPCNSYYSWLAATAGGKDSSGNAVSTDGYNAAYSICPKGWRLPTSTTSNANAQTSPNWKTGDWYALATAYGANLESNYYNSSDTNFYNNAGPGTNPNFLLAGSYYNGWFYLGGSTGYYWSSTASSSTNAYDLYFSSGSVGLASNSNRRRGASVRCVYGS